MDQASSANGLRSLRQQSCRDLILSSSQKAVIWILPLPVLAKADARSPSDDVYYNVGGETSVDGAGEDQMANTLRVGTGMALPIWRGANIVLN
jgi:hypothetical protein